MTSLSAAQQQIISHRGRDLQVERTSTSYEPPGRVCSRIALAAFAVAVAGGCTRSSPSSTSTSTSSAAGEGGHRVVTGGAPSSTSTSTSSAAGLPSRAWLEHLGAAVSTTDSRGRGEVTSCWHPRTKTLGSCDSPDPHIPRPPLRAASLDHLHALLACSTEATKQKPVKHETLTLRFTLQPSGKVDAAIPSQTVLDRAGLDACVARAARGLEEAEAGAGAGEITVRLSYWYERWCEDVTPDRAPPGRPILRMRDAKEVPRWNLVPEARGYLLASCNSPETWRFEIEGSRLAVKTAEGQSAGSIEGTPDGFVVTEASGRVVRRGRYRGSRVDLEDGRGSAVGTLSSQPSRPGDAGVEPAQAYVLPGGGEERTVSRRDGRWWVDWDSVEPDTIPARAAAVLADRTLAKPLSAALLVFFAAGLDGARRPSAGAP